MGAVDRSAGQNIRWRAEIDAEAGGATIEQASAVVGGKFRLAAHIGAGPGGTVFAGAVWLVVLGVLALAIALGGYILLGTTPTGRCDPAGFAVKRRNRLTNLDSAGHR